MQGRAGRHRHAGRDAGAASRCRARRSPSASTPRIASYNGSLVASSETTTRANCCATRSANRSSSTPLVSRCSVIPRARKICAASKTSGRSSGSPPENTTTRVPSAGSAAATSPISAERQVVGAAVLPPVARHAAAVAASGRIENQQRQDERAVRRFSEPDERIRRQRADRRRASCATLHIRPLLQRRLIRRHGGRVRRQQRDERRRPRRGGQPFEPAQAPVQQRGVDRVIRRADRRAGLSWPRRPRTPDETGHGAARLARAELGVHEPVQRAIEVRRRRSRGTSSPGRSSPPSSASARAAPGRAGRTSSRAADTRPTRRCRPARSRAPSAACARCPRASRPDTRTAGRSRPRRRPRAAARVAFTIWSIRVPFSIASRIRCDPDSAPIHAMRQPAARRARATAGVT